MRKEGGEKGGRERQSKAPPPPFPLSLSRPLELLHNEGRVRERERHIKSRRIIYWPGSNLAKIKEETILLFCGSILWASAICRGSH